MRPINIGIKSIGIYVPEGIRDSKWISGASGIPEDIIKSKFGINMIHKAAADETVSDMAVSASKKTLNGFNPEKIDLVVYCGSEYKDYYLYNCAAAIQYEIGAVNANAFEIHSLCSAGVYSLKILKSMMQTDPELENVLLVSSSRESDLIDYTNSRSRFMFNFGDGAAAVLLQRGYDRNVILETHMITDGQFAEDVSVTTVGCRNYECLYENGLESRYILDVPNLSSMKERLDPVTLSNFIKVIETSIVKSGYKYTDVSYLASIFMKRSILLNILEYFKLLEENSFVLEDYGHCQSADAFISLDKGIETGRIKDGDLIVLFGAGTGYTWAATSVKWGEC